MSHPVLKKHTLPVCVVNCHGNQDDIYNLRRITFHFFDCNKIICFTRWVYRKIQLTCFDVRGKTFLENSIQFNFFSKQDKTFYSNRWYSMWRSDIIIVYFHFLNFLPSSVVEVTCMSSLKIILLKKQNWNYLKDLFIFRFIVIFFYSVKTAKHELNKTASHENCGLRAELQRSFMQQIQDCPAMWKKKEKHITSCLLMYCRFVFGS